MSVCKCAPGDPRCAHGNINVVNSRRNIYLADTRLACKCLIPGEPYRDTEGLARCIDCGGRRPSRVINAVNFQNYGRIEIA